MVTVPPTCVSGLYFGEIVHRRLRPVSHTFRYRVCGLLVDLDEVADLDRRLRLFSYNRPNLFGFYDRDLGPRDGSSLRHWIDRHLSAVGIDPMGGSVRVLCFPRLFGYVFNPLAIWFCYDSSGRLVALLLEVSNLTRESHSYLLRVAPEDGGTVISASFDKTFYVSGFIDMAARYECRVLEPGTRVAVGIRELEHFNETLLATWSGRRVPLTDRSLLRAFVSFPLMTFKVSAAIYWQAIRLMSKGVPHYAHVSAPAGELTYAGFARRAFTPAEDPAAP
ncbi:MAG TPA: DUF1365 domain-containing protein [Vicinamibacterales bacterium]|jgi:hypothetical protein